jgi:predicted LPLAT superfamily acyltransferase
MSPSAGAPARARGAAEWTQHRERGHPLLLRLMTRLSLLLDRRASRPLLYGIAGYFFLCAPRVRRASLTYLPRALGRPARPADRFRQLLNFATVVHDRLFLLNDRHGLFDISIEGEALMAEQLRSGEGAFLIGAHLGSFEVTRAIGRRQRGLRVAMLMYADNAHHVNAMLAAINPRAALETVALGSLEAMLKVRSLLEQGVFVGMLADRTPGEEESLTVPFLGHPARFPTGPLRAAALLRRRVFLMLGLYLGGNRYRVVFEPLADFAGVPAAGRDAAVRAAVVSYARRLEAHCRRYPYNWFNFYRFWSDD